MNPDFSYKTINYDEIENKLGLLIVRDYPSTVAQTATNYGNIVMFPFPVEVLSISERHTVAGSDAGAVTLDVKNVPNGTAIASGTSMLASTFDMKSTADTAVSKSGLDLNGSRALEPKDAIALVISGTLTALEGVQVTLYVKPLGRGQFR